MAAAAVIGLSSNASAEAFTGTFNLVGGGNNVTSFAYNGTPIPNLTVSALTKVGITSSSSSNNFRGNNWPTGATNGSNTFTGALDTAKYVEFSLTAAAGKLISNPSITFGIGRSGTGPRQWQWRSSVDDFASPLAVTTINADLTHSAGVLTNPDTDSSWTGNVINTSGTEFENLTTVTFRLYGYNSEVTSGTAGLQGNLTFGGTLVDDGPDITPPAWISLSPANGSSDIPQNTTLSITFNEAIQAGAGSVILYRGATEVETFAAADGDFDGDTVTFTPSAPLAPDTAYHVIVESTAFEDLAENPFAGLLVDTDWTFTTWGPEPLPTALAPADGATNVSVTRTSLTVTFDRAVFFLDGDPIQLWKIVEDTDDLLVTEIDSVNFSISTNDNQLTITTAAPLGLDLDYAAQYYVVVPANTVEDVIGNKNTTFGAPDSAFPWTFTTLPRPAVIVNKYANIGSGTSDRIELLVIGDEVPGGTLDMRGMIIKDFSSDMTNDSGGKFEFRDVPLWEAVPVGTLITVNGGNSSPDKDSANFTLEVGLADSSLFTSLGGTFDIATTDMVMIKSAGSDAGGVAGGIHVLAAGSPGALFNAFPGPKLRATASTGTGFAVIANNTHSAASDFNGSDATGGVAVADISFGNPNTLGNAEYIAQLRGITLGDGDGVATLANATPASPLAGTPVFGSGLSDQSVTITVKAATPFATINSVVIEVPAGFGAPGGVSLAGPGTGSAGFSTDGQTVTITDAAVNTFDEIEVTISGLTSPIPGSGDFGNRAFSIATAGAGGTPAAIPTNPVALLPIPIETLRETDANGVPLALSQQVAVSGVITAENFRTTGTQAAIQDESAGVFIFNTTTSPSPFTRGNRFVVYGVVGQFNGLTDLTFAGQVDLGPDTEPEPAALSIPDLLADAESYEGSLVTLENLSYVSGIWGVSQTVVLKDANDNNINIRIQAGSTATTEPTYPVTITGVLGQFDNLSPFTTGYQLQPRDQDDLVSLAPPSGDFASWIAGFDVGAQTGFNDNPADDGIPNGLKHVFGLNPELFYPGSQVSTTEAAAGSIKFIHPLSKGALADDVSWSYQWTTNLDQWFLGGETGTAGVVVVFSTPVVLDDSHPDFDLVETTATVTEGTAEALFVRVGADLDMPMAMSE